MVLTLLAGHLREEPLLQAVEVDVLDRASTGARADQRVSILLSIHPADSTHLILSFFIGQLLHLLYFAEFRFKIFSCVEVVTSCSKLLDSEFHSSELDNVVSLNLVALLLETTDDQPESIIGVVLQISGKIRRSCSFPSVFMLKIEHDGLLFGIVLLLFWDTLSSK